MKNLELAQKERVQKMMRWKLAALIVTGLSLILSVSAYSDTYNFYFDKKKNKKQVEETKPEEETASEETGEEKAENDGEIAPSNADSKVYRAGQVPIIINNTNTNTVNPGNSVTPMEQAVTPIAPVNPVAELSSSATVEPVASQFKPSHWRLGTSVVRYTPQNVYPLDSNARYGGLVSLAYDNHRGIALNLYSHLLLAGSGRKDTGDVHLGADLEILPIRSGMYSVGREYTVFELGPVIGASTLMAQGNNLVSLHVGGRMNWYFNETMGVTFVARANLGYVMFDSGILVRL